MKLWTQNLSVRPRKFWFKTLWCDFEDCTHQTILTSREDQLTCPVTLTPWISNAWHVKIAIAAFNLPGGSVARVNTARPLLECVSPRSQVAKFLGPFMYHVSISGRTNVSYTYAHLSGTWRTDSVTLSLHTTWLITHLMVSILHEVKWNPTTPWFPLYSSRVQEAEANLPKDIFGCINISHYEAAQFLWLTSVCFNVCMVSVALFNAWKARVIDREALPLSKK